MSYAVSMGHGSPRSLSSARWWMRTRLAGLGAALGPEPYGAATSPVWPAAGVSADVIVDRPSLEAHMRGSPGVHGWLTRPMSHQVEPDVRPCDELHAPPRPPPGRLPPHRDRDPTAAGLSRPCTGLA